MKKRANNVFGVLKELENKKTPGNSAIQYHTVSVYLMKNTSEKVTGPKHCNFPFFKSVNRTNYRLCVKEIHKPNGYDPVTVTALIVGEYYMK